MENEHNGLLLGAAFVTVVAAAIYFAPPTSGAGTAALPADQVLPAAGVDLPVSWGDIGVQLVENGTVDKEKFLSLYQGPQRARFEKILTTQSDEKIRLTNENAGFVLNLFWAVGLANSNPILEDTSEMMNPAYGSADNFASTGGWTIARGGAMEHYGRHRMIELTDEQQARVDRMSRGIYRPCCNNSAHFPDCNHGMAMLGLLELMASRGVSERDMWEAALAANSYWFPDTYITIAQYMSEKRGIAWKDVDPQEALGRDFSSASGFARVAAQVAPQGAGGASCSVS